MLSKLDAFGKGISLNFRGEDKYRTNFGGFLSVVGLGILLPYVLIKFIQLVDRSDPNSTFNEVYHDIKGMGELSGVDINYDFAYSLIDKFGNALPAEVDETYFMATVSLIQVDTSKVELLTLGEELDFIKCNR